MHLRVPRRMGRRHLLSLVPVLTFIALTIWLLRSPHPPVTVPKPAAPYHDKPHPTISNPNAHPIHQLVEDAERELETVKARQSQSLGDAVAEYRRRYQIPPPPNFDKWFSFAKQRGVQLIDEFDTIHHSLLPFWALEPSTIRARTREALGFDNALMGVSVRDGKIVLCQGGQEWQQQATVGMTESFVPDLPDMDIAFNIHDEPRVVVPHEDLARLVDKAKTRDMPVAFGNESPKNSFSRRPADMNDGQEMTEYKTTRFNRYAHQPTWVVSKLSCDPDSPARAIEDNAEDNVSSYATSELGFVYNTTAFSDICQSPSFRETYGFFDRPNAFDIVHELFPIFSQSKVGSFQDILYPSPWYWDGKVTYDEEQDMDWEQKADEMYWRGSTTGGFSRDGGWRRQHRQKVVQCVNALNKAKILQNAGTASEPQWRAAEVDRQAYAELFNVSFSHVGQCDPLDCDAQREFFQVVNGSDFQTAWAFKYLLDMDGNAFSGRFYAFLHSRSLVYKLAIFREWHADWLRPWAHYIPLSLHGQDLLESVRYFAEEDEGKVQAPRLALQGRNWAQKALRNEDLEVWLYRLLLEYVSSPVSLIPASTCHELTCPSGRYARLIDDKRAEIGYG